MEQNTQQSSFKAYFWSAYYRFLKIRGNPREIALGFALGIFIGMSPTMGIQMPLAIFFAVLLKWNKISAVSGVWITNPLTAPFVYGATFFLGSKVIVLNNSFTPLTDFSFSTLLEMIERAPFFLLSLFIGGIIIGLPLAVIGYFISLSALERYQEKIKRSVRMKKEAIALQKKKMKERMQKRKQSGSTKIGRKK